MVPEAERAMPHLYGKVLMHAALCRKLPPTLVLGLLVFRWAAAAAWAQAPTHTPAETSPLPSAPLSESSLPPPDPQITMFPHPEGARYWLSGQANVIFQGRLPFHSLYEGPNSFRNSAEYKVS